MILNQYGTPIRRSGGFPGITAAVASYCQGRALEQLKHSLDVFREIRGSGLVDQHGNEIAGRSPIGSTVNVQTPVRFQA